MFHASYRNTVAGARRIAAERGLHPGTIRRKEGEACSVVVQEAAKAIQKVEMDAFNDKARGKVISLLEESANRLARQRGDVTSYLRIERLICRALKVTPAQVRGKCREKRLVLARQAVMYWTRRLTKHSWNEIAKKIGGKDHTTIISGVDAYPSKRASQGRYLRAVR